MTAGLVGITVSFFVTQSDTLALLLAGTSRGSTNNTFCQKMIPIGYMAKLVAPKPDWLKTDQVDEILSVSSCVSTDFADWINYWRHNGFWFFDSPSVILELSAEYNIDLSADRWFYYEAHDMEYDEDGGGWRAFEPEKSFITAVDPPADRQLLGYDIVTFTCGTSAECSPLSCNHLAEHMKVNRQCLMGSFEEAVNFIDEKSFLDCEPGPYRILAVYEVPTPRTKETEQDTPTDRHNSHNFNPNSPP